MRSTTVYIIGNGQLGKMLAQAADTLSIKAVPLDFTGDVISLDKNHVVTAEIERWEQTPRTEELAKSKNFINKDIFAQIADRLSQKQLIDKLRLNTSTWKVIQDYSDFKELFNHKKISANPKLVVKARTGGYDGRSQWIVTPDDYKKFDKKLFGEVIAEGFINFDYEMSVVGARFNNGEKSFFPIINNLQKNGILRASFISQRTDHKLNQQAQQMLGKIMDELNYVGVMAMECFVNDDEIIINELAPRVHNSGHLTQLATNISQFELHLRALLDLPTPPIDLIAPALMLNIIGSEFNPKWLELSHGQVHWYGKDVRTGRKLGHINMLAFKEDKNELYANLDSLLESLSEDYKAPIFWLKNKLAQEQTTIQTGNFI